MSEFKERIDALAALMEEYRLTEATIEDGPFRVAFRRETNPIPGASLPHVAPPTESFEEAEAIEAPRADAPSGTPIATPMSGIFYDAPSPSSPPFLREGDAVVAGQIVGLIEAMKVFNEIPSPVSGTVRRIVVESGAVVNLGDTLILLG